MSSAHDALLDRLAGVELLGWARFDYRFHCCVHGGLRKSGRIFSLW